MAALSPIKNPPNLTNFLAKVRPNTPRRKRLSDSCSRSVSLSAKINRCINHPDHTLITYPNLGHGFYPSSQWSTSFGPVPPYVLAELYSWLESHSGLSHSLATAASAIGANTTSSSSKR
jgi:hypothetical protein